MGLKRLLVLFIFMLPLLSGLAQQYNYRQYTSREGLPSMVVYDVEQDTDGFIWVSTKDGLCKFDGYRFKVFTTDDGLPDNEIIGINTGPDGKMWALPFRSRVAYIYKDSVYLAEGMDDINQPVRRFDVDSRGHLWITRVSGVMTEYKDTILKTFDPNYFSQTTNSSYYGYADSSGNAWLAFDSALVRIDTSGVHQKWIIKNQEYKFNTARIVFIAPSQNKYLYNTLVVLRFMGDSTKVVFNAGIAGNLENFRILNLLVTANEEILVATSQGAYRVKELDDGSITYERFLAGKSVGKVFEDNEGNLWFCTLTDGLYMLSAASREVVNIGAENGLFKTMPGAIFVFRDTLAVSSNYGDVYTIQQVGKRFVPYKKSFSLYTEGLGPCIDVDGMGTWCGSNTGLNIFEESQGLDFDEWQPHDYSFSVNTPTNRFSHGKNILNFSTVKALAKEPGPNGKIWAATSNGLFVVDPFTDNQKLIVSKLNFNRAATVAVDNNGTVWASLMDGINYWHNDTLMPIPGYNIQAFATCMLSASSGIMWIGTPKGLYGFDGIGDETPLHLTTKSGLPSNIVNYIIEMSAGLVIATDKGITLLQYTQGKYKLIPLQVNDGLISKEVRQMVAWHDKLIALTSKGLSIVDTVLIRADTTAPKLFITLVNIAGKDTVVLPNYTVAYDNNSIRLEYVGLSYKSDGDILYRYKMEGIDTTWTQTEFTNVQYPTLPAGHYTFLVDARSLQGDWSNRPAKLQVTVLPPFWQTWWFRVLVALLVVAIASVISYAVIRYYRNQSDIARRITQLEGQALRAQMNPHFIFNALNAIHDFIANSDERSAHLYLGKFAKLIRKILDQSRKAEISLEEEIETLELYIELEKLRFPKRFSCFINCHHDLIKSDIHIPPMLVQPYVENAIRHGLMNSDKPGTLEISFEKENGLLKVIVKDDGVGRHKASEISSKRLKEHRSAAIEITKHRVHLHNSQGKESSGQEVTITDLRDVNGQPAGTKVTFWIPIKTE